MSDQVGSSCFQALFEAALQNYEEQTGTTLSKHPLAELLQNCDSFESFITILQEQAHDFSEFRGSDKITKPLKNTVPVLCTLFNSASLLVCLRRRDRVFHGSDIDPYSIAIFSRKCDTRWYRYPSLRMHIFQVSTHVSFDVY
jgi:hypothetical protein